MYIPLVSERLFNRKLGCRFRFKACRIGTIVFKAYRLLALQTNTGLLVVLNFSLLTLRKLIAANERGQQMLDCLVKRSRAFQLSCELLILKSYSIRNTIVVGPEVWYWGHVIRIVYILLLPYFFPHNPQPLASFYLILLSI